MSQLRVWKPYQIIQIKMNIHKLLSRTPKLPQPNLTLCQVAYIEYLYKINNIISWMMISNLNYSLNPLGTTAKPTTKKTMAMSTRSKSSDKQEGKIIANLLIAALLMAFAWNRNIVKNLIQFTSISVYFRRFSFFSECSTSITFWLCWTVSFLYSLE